jgi:hypothetical protein
MTVSSRYETAVGILLPPLCVYDRYMHVYVCVSRYLISICMYCMYWNTGAQKPPQRPKQFCVLDHIATAVESFRIVQAGSNLA